MVSCGGMKAPGMARPALHILTPNILSHLDVEKKASKLQFLSFPTDSQLDLGLGFDWAAFQNLTFLTSKPLHKRQ